MLPATITESNTRPIRESADICIGLSVWDCDQRITGKITEVHYSYFCVQWPNDYLGIHYIPSGYIRIISDVPETVSPVKSETTDPGTVTLWDGTEEPADSEDIIELTCGDYAGDFALESDVQHIRYGWNGQTGTCLTTESTRCDWCRHYTLSCETSECQGSTICERCTENTFYCESCEGRYHDDYYGGDDLCRNCYEDEEEEDEDDYDGVLRPYSYHGYSSWPREDSSGTQFGIELEVEARGSRGSAVSNVMGLFPDMYLCAKTDGSLDYAKGIEFVTRPDSFNVHKRLWTNALPSMSKEVRAWRALSCGMHIHVGRKTLSALQIAKMVMFMNAPETGRFIQHIAGRDVSRWAQRKSKTLHNVKHPGDRYECLNLTNVYTIEFRIFRSNVGLRGFMRNLEFCQAMVDWSRPCQTTYRESTSLGSFVRFVNANGRTYPNLHNHVSQFDF